MNAVSMTDLELEDWLKKVNVAFYDLVYDHPWLGLIFKSVEKEFIVSQQTDFMLGVFGGQKRFSGRAPNEAHPHIYVDEEMWNVRESLLKQAFEQTNCPEMISNRWLKIDEAFKSSIIMNSPSQCRPRYATDEFIIISNPDKLKKAS